VIVFFPAAYTGSGPSYTAMSIAKEMTAQGKDLTFFCPAALADIPSSIKTHVPFSGGLPYRLVGRGPIKKLLTAMAERQVLREIRRRGRGVHLHLWGGASHGFVTQAKALGAVIFRELINTHMATAKRILDAESERLALSPQHNITAQMIERQRSELAVCDFLCSPSSGVDNSLEEWGVPRDRIIKTSFGWEPERFPIAAAEQSPARSSDGKVTALFVGQLSVRKGIHLAIDAWKAADLDGQFILVGRIDPGFRSILDANLGQKGLIHHEFTADITRFYRSSDFLLFPTLEEGAPLICYEATGCGLPVITTEMGTARLIEDDRNGLIVDAHNHDALVSSIRAMTDPALRQRLSDGASQIARKWTWNRAAQDRMAAFERVQDRA